MKEKNQNLKAGGLLTTIVLGIIIGILAFHSITETVTLEKIAEVQQRDWKEIPLGADPGSGLSGVVNVTLVKHGLYEYTSNLTSAMHNSSWYGFGETNDTEIGINVPYGIKFDIAVKVVWNRTMMYNTTNSNWTWEWVNATIALTLVGYTSGYPGGGGNGRNISGEWNCSKTGWVSTNTRAWAYYVFGAGIHSGTGLLGGAPPAGGNNNGISINKSQRVPTCYFKFFAYY